MMVAVLKTLLPEEISTVIVHASGHGSQQFGFGHRDVNSETKILTLLPAGRLRGQLTGAAEAIRGRRLSVVIWNPKRGPAPATALSYVTTDAEGRFEVPEIAEGPVRISSEPDITSPWYIQQVNNMNVVAGRTTDLKVPLGKAVRISGLVRERGTGKPIEGVGVASLFFGWADGNDRRSWPIQRLFITRHGPRLIVSGARRLRPAHVRSSLSDNPARGNRVHHSPDRAESSWGGSRAGGRPHRQTPGRSRGEGSMASGRGREPTRPTRSSPLAVVLTAPSPYMTCSLAQ